MACIHDLPCELLLQIMEYCDSDLLSLARAYPTALNCFSKNRKYFVARMLAPFGDVALPSFVLAARLRHMRQEPDFKALNTREVQAKIRPLVSSRTEEQLKPPELCKFSLSALCVMWELAEDAKRITDIYPQQALENMATKPDDKLYHARQSTGLTPDEQRRFMDAAFDFEGYCLAFFRGQQLLYWENEWIRECFFGRHLWMNEINHQTTVGRFYCIMHYMLQEYNELLSTVVGHLESVHSRVASLPTMGKHEEHKEEYFMCHFRFDPEDEEDGVVYGSKAENYFHYLASQGLMMFTRLQKMSIEELTEFTVTTFWRIAHSQCPEVSIMDLDDFPLGTRLYRRWLPWPYLNSILLVECISLDSDIWVDIWTRAVPFWDLSEEENPYGVEYITNDWTFIFWCLAPVV